MVRILALCLCMFLSSAVMPLAGEASGSKGSEAKEMSGMSIVGNDEAPKSLYIVPWKSSEIGHDEIADTTTDLRSVGRPAWTRCSMMTMCRWTGKFSSGRSNFIKSAPVNNRMILFESALMGAPKLMTNAPGKGARIDDHYL